ncbi:MAG: putative unusual protein kinase regulating ubiquinone biosynthesis (AarF/ABC1/UbiB family) [Kiritimatiellia bacterium]|jgi:predicted unusual protein kinase regulating ubiquinone biosynthesis (AarF/ABC1/UbiB family)
MASRPPSRLGRLARLGRLTTKVTGSYVGERVKDAIRGSQLGQKARDKLHIENAERLVDAMGQLKGAAMKVGQSMAMAARSMDLPPEVAERLAKLNKDAEPVPFEVIKEEIERELEMPLEQAFRSLDPKPIGTASLAQAHGAIMHDGTDVVIKVLHRGIEDGVATDLLALKAMLIGSRVLRRDRGEIDGAFAEIQARLYEELDYLQEAANIHAFHHQWKDDPDVRVPRVHGSHSTERVLTMDRMPGVHVDIFARTGTDEAKQRAGATMARMYYVMAFRNRTLHADPHPGNYMFEEDGRVGLLDFGCVKRFDEFWIGRYCKIARAALNGDREETLEQCRQMGVLVGHNAQSADVLWSFCCALVHHMQVGGFRLGTSEDTIVQDMKPAARSLAGHPDIRVPPDVIFLHRALGGIYSISKRLHPQIDPRALFDEHGTYAIRRADGHA